MKTVYLDTSSINKLYDGLHKEVRPRNLKKYIYPISSCQIDELCSIGSAERRSALVEFIFGISNKQKLKDHIEIMAEETLHHLKIKIDLDYIDPKYKEFNDLIKVQIKRRMPEIHQEHFYTQMELAKKQYRTEENLLRKIFKPSFDLYKKIGIKKDFKEIFEEMENEGLINNFLYERLELEENLLGYNFSKIKEEIMKISLSELKCTYTGLQSKFAYSYLSSFEDGKISIPKNSDQVDVRHLFYLNYANIFVTDDEKMLRIGRDMLNGLDSIIQNTDNFIENYL